MDELIPLAFIAYIVGTFIAAVIKKRRGELQRRDLPPYARPAPPLPRRPVEPPAPAGGGWQPVPGPARPDVEARPWPPLGEGGEPRRPSAAETGEPYGPARADGDRRPPAEALEEPVRAEAVRDAGRFEAAWEERPEHEWPAGGFERADDRRDEWERAVREEPAEEWERGTAPVFPELAEFPGKAARTAPGAMGAEARGPGEGLEPVRLRLSRDEMRRAVLLAELLAGPRALRPYEPPAGSRRR